MERKGQAAMEFLMTYGWAILAAVIAIGVLVYFGVFSPSRLVPETCVLSAPLGCNNDKAVVDNSANQVQLFIANGGDADITITNMDITGCNAAFVPTVPTLKVGEELQYNVGCTPAVGSVGTQFKGTITVTYNKGTGTRDMTSTGSIARKIIA